MTGVQTCALPICENVLRFGDVLTSAHQPAVPAVPADVSRADTEAFVGHYEWVLNWSFQFAGRPWDVVPVNPSVDSELDEAQQVHAQLARQIMIGKDIRFIDRSAEDTRERNEVIAACYRSALVWL